MTKQAAVSSSLTTASIPFSDTLLQKRADESIWVKGLLRYHERRGVWKIKARVIGEGAKVRFPDRPELVYVVTWPTFKREWGFFVHAGSGRGWQSLHKISSARLHMETLGG